MVVKVLVGVSVLALAPFGAAAADVPQPVKPALVETYGKLPLSFEANAGQADPQVKFLSRGRGYRLFLTSTEAVLVLRESGGVHSIAASPAAKPERGKALPGTVLRMRLVGANRAPVVAGVGELPGKSNYLVGNDPKKWRANVPTYAKVEYRGIYPGVNLVYYGNQRQLEYDFVVSPGADPKAITLAFEGVESLAIDGQGDLVLQAHGGEVRLRKPFVYQDHDGQRAVIPTSYVLKAERQVAFEVAAYDATKPLIIDPVLAYSTFLGGNNFAGGDAIAVDAAGNAYVTGFTQSTDFPTTPGAFQPGSGGFGDAFVIKLNPTGDALVYSTYLGGSSDDHGFGIAVDAAGSAYVTGQTDSRNFPTTPGAFQTVFGGGQDAFVTKLNPTGSALVYSTYLGGSHFDGGSGIAVDAGGNAYVTGFTPSTNFPTTPSAFQTVFGGGQDAFVTKLNAAGSALVYSTYLGGSSSDTGFGIAVDAADSAYVTGFTVEAGAPAGVARLFGGIQDEAVERLSTDFPTTPGAFQTVLGGGRDAFVTKLNAAGSALVYSTFLGGSDFDLGSSIAVDAGGNAYVTGATNSADFPVTTGAVQPGFGGGQDAFVTKLNPTGSALVYSTYLGGSEFGEEGRGIAVDAAGSAYVTGATNSADFPVTTGAVQPGFGGGDEDAFVTKLNATGSALVYSTYLGGSSSDTGVGIAVDAAGNAYVTGRTFSTNFPTTPGAVQPGLGDFDAFVAKFSFGNTPTGSNVIVPLGDPPGQVTVTFATVTAAGDTTLTTSTAGPPPPAGLKLGDPPTYYELATTASFSGSVTVCITYTGITFDNEADLKLFHFEDPSWMDATTSLDTANDIICGRVSSLSPFAIFEPAIQLFEALLASVEIEDERDEREFEVEATFTLGAASDGIAPLTEDVRVQVGSFSTTIPVGSFRRHGRRAFEFEGLVNGVALEAKIRSLGGGRFAFKLEGEGADLAGSVNPVTVGITIGNDGGTTMVTAEFDD